MTSATPVPGVGATSTAGPPQGASAPLGGSDGHVVPSVGAFIFDMDGTIVDSMEHHAQSWVRFMQRHGMDFDVAELMRRTTGRNGAECMRELFERELSDAEAWALIADKEALYRELFGPVFAEVRGFTRFAALARARGLRMGVGTAGDRHNIAFVRQHLGPEPALHTVVGGDEGWPGKPEPAIFLEVARQLGVPPAACIVFEDAPLGIEAARRGGMRAVALCTSHRADELVGPHVLAHARNFDALIENRFLETLDVVPA